MTSSGRAPASIWPAMPAGPELHTHMAHYQGEITARNALGGHQKPDLRRHPARDLHRSGDLLHRAAPRAGPERGIDAEEFTRGPGQDRQGRGRGGGGHVTIVVDRGAGTLVGVFMAGPA